MSFYNRINYYIDKYIPDKTSKRKYKEKKN
jgi:hypothetical protein